MLSMVLCMHYKEPLKSFEIRVGHSPGFGPTFVAILPHCKRRKAIFTHALTLCLIAAVISSGDRVALTRPPAQLSPYNYIHHVRLFKNRVLTIDLYR